MWSTQTVMLGLIKGHVAFSGNGEQADTVQDFYSGFPHPSERSPNSQQSSPHRSHSGQLLFLYYTDDRGDPIEEGSAVFAESGKERTTIYTEMTSPNSISPGPIRLPNGKLQCEVCGMICIGPNVLMVHRRSHTGERPFQCNQCGASFTQKGNLLRHIKLHSGEKPFKCPICNYACRRRDALAGHLRTHAVSSPAVGKPFKCSYCSRSYKQQSTLEEHLERCHSYLKSLESQTGVNIPTAQGSSKVQFVDRLAISITKRKRSTPQKFLGEKHTHLNPPEAPYELSSGSEKDGDLMSSHPARDSVDLIGSHLQYTRGKGENRDSSQLHPAFLAELSTVMGSINSNSKTPPQGPRAHGGGGLTAMSLSLASREAGEGRDEQPSAHSHNTSPDGCPDSTDTESTAEDTSNNNHHLHYQTPALPRSHPTDTVQVFDRDGQPVRSFHCRHCRILFLDHVMFTIHMGCHGFRQPFECNICGHRSHDRYEFSSHISRGEHQVG
uniref:Zinc finger protein Eos-like n=1 Tax=Gouania willdenowi TaxID=441366 RepID=A0A8C5GNL2_GOUWI